MKKVLCILTLLCMVCTGAWAQGNLQASTEGEWEHQYGMYIVSKGTNYWLTCGLHSGLEEKLGLFSFVSVDGVDDAYYIYSMAESKWLTYSNTDNGQNKISLSNEKSSYFKATYVQNGKGTGYTLQAYSDGAAINRYINFYEGPTANSYPTTGRVGFWQDGNTDAGSIWALVDMEDLSGIYTKGDVVTQQSDLKNGDKLILDVKAKNTEYHLYYTAEDNTLTNKANYRVHITTGDYFTKNHVWEVSDVTTTNGQATFKLKSCANADAYLPNGDKHGNGTEAAILYLQVATGYTDETRFAFCFTNKTENRGVYHFDKNDNKDNTQGISVCFWGYNQNTTDTQGAFMIHRAEEYIYVANEDIIALREKINNAWEAIYDEKVGYPNINDEINTSALQELVQYVTYGNLESPINAETYAEALRSLNDVYSLSSVNLPEDGKAYTISAVYSGGKDKLYYDTSAERIKGAANASTNTVFICKKITNNKYILVNESGHYLVWGASSTIGGTHRKACADTYSNLADITIAKATENTNGDGAKATLEQCFGNVTLQGLRENESSLWYANYNHVTDDGNTFVESGNTATWYDGAGNRTHMYRIEEVTDYAVNKTTLKTPKVGDGKTYASIYLPYAVELPEGVAAYKVTSTSDASFHLEEISEDGNLPKETGAILVGEDTNMKTLVPCAATPTAQKDNKLGGCKESTLVSSLGMGTVYVLNGGQDSGIGFFPLSSSANLSPYKAYYREENTPVQGFSFNFDEAIVTAIENLSTTGSQNSEVYDLQGRRMQRVQKGLNIVNGRKVIR